MVNKKYILEIEVLTPTSIGAGAEKDWMKGVDFVENRDKIYIINLRKMMQNGIDVGQISSYFADKKDREILRILGNKLEDVSDYIFKKPASTSNDIKYFIKNELSGEPIIPGSSLKGAIRSIFFKYLRKDERKEIEVFGNTSNGNEFMRFFKISDIAFERTELVNTKIFNLQNKDGYWQGGWKHGKKETNDKFQPMGFNTIYEAIMPESKGLGSLMIAETTFSLFGKDRQKYGEKKASVLDIKTLFKIINDHTRAYLEKELAFFEKYHADRSDEIEAFIRSLLSEIAQDESYCILKMSAGSGFHSITGDWQYDDYRNIGDWNGRKYKSRKVAVHNEELTLMGFVKLRSISEMEAKCIEQERRERHEEQKKEQERIIEERRKVQEEKKKVELDKIKYQGLITQAYTEPDKYKAILLYEQASNLFPEENYPKERMYEIRNSLERECAEKEAKIQREKEAVMHRQQQIDNGLSFLDEKFDDDKYKVTDFKGAKNRIEGWIKKAKVEVLPESEIDILRDSLRRIYQDTVRERDKKEWLTFGEGVWKFVVKWTNIEKAKSIFDQILNS